MGRGEAPPRLHSHDAGTREADPGPPAAKTCQDDADPGHPAPDDKQNSDHDWVLSPKLPNLTDERVSVKIIFLS